MLTDSHRPEVKGGYFARAGGVEEFSPCVRLRMSCRSCRNAATTVDAPPLILGTHPNKSIIDYM